MASACRAGCCAHAASWRCTRAARRSTQTSGVSRTTGGRWRSIPRCSRTRATCTTGFAAGVNRYLAQHPEEFAGWVADPFTGHDVAALFVYRSSASQTRRWINRLTGAPDAPLRRHQAQRCRGQTATPVEEGSSAWALAPSRTTSGAAILLRNPHLSWDAGYWEAHAVVPGRLDFYGDFRIGAPLGIVGGFNPYLGFATTNNDVDNGQVYALAIDPTRLDHYVLDGASVPLGRELVTRRFRNGDGYGFETRERVFTDLGPVIHLDHGRIYILRTPEDGEFRGGEQFLRMMQATTLDEWTDAMRLRAHPRSNFTYADGAGNVFYLWNAAMPVFPHPYDDTRAVPVTRRSQIWSAMHELNELPQVLNPPGGYVRNENDGPWLTNLRAPLDPANYPAHFEAQGFRLRSQHSALLVGTDEQLSLEEVVRRKHSYRMLLADRVKSDLLAGIRRGLDEGTLDSDAVGATTLADALTMLEAWDNTAAPASRGGVLFERWWNRYTDAIEAAYDGDGDPQRSRKAGRPRHPRARREDWPIRRWQHGCSRPRSRRRWRVSVRGTWRGATCTASGEAGWTCRWAAARAHWGATACSTSAPTTTPAAGSWGAMGGCSRWSSRARLAPIRSWPTGRVAARHRRITPIRRRCSRAAR